MEDLRTQRVLEVAGSAEQALARAADLRAQGWTVFVRSTRLTERCEFVWTLEVYRPAC